VRLALRADAFPGSPAREERENRLLSAADEELFKIEELTIALPPEAEIHKSVICAACGEPVMETRTRTLDGRVLCIPCAEKESKK
jgi:formylmethanofuran dehydrogenase subunit E